MSYLDKCIGVGQWCSECDHEDYCPRLKESKMSETLCPFEKVKFWKTGVSVKCPRPATSVIWTKDTKTALREHLFVKRKVTCSSCISDFDPFIDSLGDLEVE